MCITYLFPDLFRTNKEIAATSTLTYHCYCENENVENINSIAITIDDIKRIIAGEKHDIDLDPNEKIIEVRVVREPIASSALPVGPVVHHIVILRTQLATYAIEKFDDGLHLTKTGSVEYFMKRRKHNTRAVDLPFKEQPKQDRDSIGCVIEWLLTSKELNIEYHWYSSNCKTFADSLCLFITGVRCNQKISNFNFIRSIRYSLSTWDRSVIEFNLANLLHPIPLPNERLRRRFWEWVYAALDSFVELRYPDALNPFNVIASCVPNNTITRSISDTYVIVRNQRSKKVKMNLIYGAGAFAIVLYSYWTVGITTTFYRCAAVYSLLGLASKSINILRSFYQQKYCHFGTDLKAIIDETLDLSEGEFLVSIICDKAKKFGGHEFLFIEWHKNGKKQFRTAELWLPKNTFTLFDLFSGDCKVKIKSAENIAQAKILLTGVKKLFFATFKRTGNVEEMLKVLKNETHTFSSFGDHSIASINSRDNNQNCASWCVLALKVMGITLDVPLISTPCNVVLSARRHRQRKIRHLITDSGPGPNVLKIYVVCDPESKFGGHSFLLFEWTSNENDREVRKFFRAELNVEIRYLSDLSSGDGIVVKSEFVTGLIEGSKLLKTEAPFFTSFSYICEGNIEEKLNTSSIFETAYTYKVFGENSLTESMDLNDIHNCATFINYVLKTDFDIDLGLDREKLLAITTPMHIVDLADEHQMSE